VTQRRVNPVAARRLRPIPGVSEAAARSAGRIVTLYRGFDDMGEDLIDDYAGVAERTRAEDRDW
jgi:hypothetical protein